MQRFILCVLFCLVTVISARDDELFGWSERTIGRKAQLGSAKRGVIAQQGSAPVLDDDDAPSQEETIGQPTSERETGVEVMSWDPRILLYRGLLTDEECDHIIEVSKPGLHRSEVVALGGGEEKSDIRTSEGTFLRRYQTPIIERVEKKVAAWTMIPPDFGETLQVLKYEKGQEYKPHHDFIFHESGFSNGGNRLATVLMYLATPIKGGETVFPEVSPPPEQTLEAGFSECAMQGLAVKAVKGDAVVFWNIEPTGLVAKKAMHGSCPVIEGTKYAATKWIHLAHYATGGEAAKTLKPIIYGTNAPPPQPDWCNDTENECIGWAAVGECERNPGFMIGTEGNPGKCLNACNRCDLIEKNHQPI